MKFVQPNQLDSKRPGTWPIYYQVLVWIGILALMIFLYGRFVREDLISQQQKNQTQIQDLEREYKTAYQYSVDLQLYEQRKQELSKKLVSLLEFLPAETEMPSLLEEIYKASYKSNINFTEFTPQNSIVNQYYDTMPISLKTSTGFSNLASFIQYIGELPRILNIRQFNLDIDQNTPETINVSSNLETYIYNQDISQFIDSDQEVNK